MTVEHRLIFEITDIKAVTLECKKCKGRFVMDPEHEPTISQACPICSTKWFSLPIAGTGRYPSDLYDLVTAIGNLRGKGKNELTEVGFVLRLEFDAPSTT